MINPSDLSMPIFLCDRSLGSISWVPYTLDPPSRNTSDPCIKGNIASSTIHKVLTIVFLEWWDSHGHMIIIVYVNLAVVNSASQCSLQYCVNLCMYCLTSFLAFSDWSFPLGRSAVSKCHYHHYTLS